MFLSKLFEIHFCISFHPRLYISSDHLFSDSELDVLSRSLIIQPVWLIERAPGYMRRYSNELRALIRFPKVRPYRLWGTASLLSNGYRGAL
jgi:hypothetical protein